MKPLLALPVLAAVAALGLAGCGSDDTTGSDAGAGATLETTTSAPVSAAPGGLATAESPLGTIVVDGAGRTVYLYDQDTQGATTSACADDCLVAWPPVPGGDGMAGEGVTAEVGTITGSDGQPQLTLDGWPLYYYAEDRAPGDLKGQGVGGVWWVLAPDGTRIETMAEEEPAESEPAESEDTGGGDEYGY